MQKCYKVIFCNYICQEFDILVLVLYSFDRSLWISTFVCLSVCLSVSISLIKHLRLLASGCLQYALDTKCTETMGIVA